MLAHFNQLSLIGVVANLLVVPLAAVGHHPRHARAAGRAGLERRSPRCSSTRSGSVLVIALRAGRVAGGRPARAPWSTCPRRPRRPWSPGTAALALAPASTGASRASAPSRCSCVAGGGTLDLALARGPPTAAARDLPRRRPGRRDAHRAAGGAAAARGRRARRRARASTWASACWRRSSGTGRSPGSTWSRSRTADADHSGGLAAVLRHFHVGEFWENGRPPGGAPETCGRARAVARAAPRARGRPAPLARRGADHRAQRPARSPAADGRTISPWCCGWTGGASRCCSPATWARAARRCCCERAGPLRALVLKVAHHGSRFSSTAPFLERARPRLAVISVGARNPFRHPSAEALARLDAAGARVYRTDRDGAVILETDGRVLASRAWAPRRHRDLGARSRTRPRKHHGPRSDRRP